MMLKDLAKKLEGLQTVSSISKILQIDKRTSINYASKLRKAGYLTTEYRKRKIRIYTIGPLKREKKGYSLYDLLNENTKIKIASKEDYIIHSEKKPSVEEVLVRCIATRDFRIVLASLGLFNKIKNWSKLKFYADTYKSGRKIGALYDVAKTIIKIKRMDQRTRKSLLNSKDKERYIISRIKSKDFSSIEKLWKIYIPFNKADLEAYKE